MKRWLCIAVLLLVGVGSFAQRVKLNDFNSVKIFGKIEIRFEQSEQPGYFFTSGKPYTKQISIQVKDSVLSIKMLKSFPPDISASITIYGQSVKSLKAGGGARIYNKGVLNNLQWVNATSNADIDVQVQTDTIAVIAIKGGFIRLTGNTRTLSAKTGAGGVLRLADFTSIYGYIVMNGGDASINVTNALWAKVRIGGLLKYTKRPKKLSQSLFMNGKIKLLEDF